MISFSLAIILGLFWSNRSGKIKQQIIFLTQDESHTFLVFAFRNELESMNVFELDIDLVDHLSPAIRSNLFGLLLLAPER